MTAKKKLKRISGVPIRLQGMFPNVTKVVDAKTSVSVAVDKKDVTAARRMEADACAMAKAICRDKKADGAMVGMAYTYVVNGNTATRYTTPPPVQREIVSFDRHEDFAPGEYMLQSISPSQRLGEWSKRKRSETRAGGDRHRAGYVAPKRIVHKKTVRVRELRGAAK